MSQSSLLIAQITDTHLFANAGERLLGLQTAESLRAVLAEVKILKRQPDLLLLTGDLSQDGSGGSYELLQHMLESCDTPAYWIPGNHDNPDVMAQVLRRSPFSCQKSFFAGGWHLLLLDTSVPGCVHGYLSQNSLTWLDHELHHSGNKPALIALHHPPLQIGSAWMNDIGLLNAEALLDVCDRHSHVKLVSFGHIHQEFNHDRRGVRYLGTPSTCIQFKPNSVDFALDDKHPGFRLFELLPNGDWQSSIHRVSCTSEPDLAAVGY